MKLVKRLSFFFVIFLGLTWLTACGETATSVQPSAATSSATQSEPVKLIMTIWGNDTHLKLYQDMAGKFKERYPNVTVEIQSIPFSDYQQRLSIAVAGSTPPDVSWLAERMIPQFTGSNQLMNLANLRNDSAYDFADFLPSTLALFKKNDQLFGIPFSTPPFIYFYNKTMFQQKGLKTPTELYKEGKWNYTEFLKTAKSLSEPAKGIYGVRLFRNNEWKNWPVLFPLLWANSAEVFNQDTTQFTFNSGQGEKALQLFNDMLFKDEIHPKPNDSTTFESGKIGIYQDNYSYTATARKIKDFDWDIAPLPSGPGGATTVLGLAGYTIFQNTRHPREAMEWLKFISSKDNMGLTSQFFVPPRQSVLNSDVFLKIAAQPSPESIKLAVLEQMKEARYLPSHRNWSNIDEAIEKNFERLYAQTISVKEALEGMQKEVTPLLK